MHVKTATFMGAGKASGLEPRLDVDFAHYLVDECGLSQSTAWTYARNIERVEKFLDRDATTVKVGQMRSFLRESSFHPATKNGCLVAIKQFVRFCRLEGVVADEALLALRGPKQVRNPRPALTTEEALTVLASVRRPVDYRALWLPLYAGTRISESARIMAEEWAREDRLYFKGKGGKYREVPVHAELLNKREDILDNSSTADALKHVVRSASHYTGIPFTSHTLRRTFAQHLVEEGVLREVVGDLLGHAQGVTVQAYAPITWHEKVDAMERLGYEGGR
jgi:site-specific recombinase XerD